ncbi:MAG TPA: glycerol-3-phosphate dehydrogenase [Methylibium sp.]|nr:glycerol-3-phosphate dehydrogenase [Methylibium sp.]
MGNSAGSTDMPLRCDVLVVGGGINGCGIARDLAGRGWRVVLAERDDLAAHTSSASTKLIHGGLRYLEHREFALVRKSLQERERLMRCAPHLIRPLSFVMPHDAAMRPAWMIRAGLFLYDHLARREWLPASHAIDLRTHPAGAALQPRCSRGFVYSDGWADDARLVVANAIDARERGATVLTRTECVAVQRHDGGWRATLRLAAGGETRVEARVLVNAAGPWAERFLREVAPSLATRQLRLVKGSHIVVPARFAHEHAYLFQNPDRRVIFAIPYERDYTLIGTTDQELHGDPGTAAIDADETAYLCEQASRWLARPVTPADVVWSYAGVRPLLDDPGVPGSGDPSAVTRDYLLERGADGAPLLTIWGGKLTTFRRLAEEASDAVGALLGERRPAWTAAAALPGGDLSAWTGAPTTPPQDFARFVRALHARHPWLPEALALRLARAYGSRVERLLGGAALLAALGAEIAPGLHEAELEHLLRDEWALTAEDMLWRRSKLGLHYDAAQRAAVGVWLASRSVVA